MRYYWIYSVLSGFYPLNEDGLSFGELKAWLINDAVDEYVLNRTEDILSAKSFALAIKKIADANDLVDLDEYLELIGYRVFESKELYEY